MTTEDIATMPTDKPQVGEWLDRMRAGRWNGYGDPPPDLSRVCWHGPHCALDCWDHRDLLNANANLRCERDEWKRLAAEAGKRTGDTVVAKLGQLSLFTNNMGAKTDSPALLDMLHAGIEMETRTLSRLCQDAAKRIDKVTNEMCQLPESERRNAAIHELVRIDLMLGRTRYEMNPWPVCPTCNGKGILG